MLIVTLGLVGRVFYLMIIDRHFLLGQGDARSLRIVSIPAYRGMITDRNGAPLAISTPVTSLWIDPEDFNPTQDELKQLGSLIQMDPSEIKELATKNQDKSFAYLTRGLDPYIGVQVRELNIAGIYFQQEFRRFYPEGEVSAHLLGFTNIDDVGQEGIELAYDSWLTGIPGKKRVLKDRLGREVANLDLIKPAQPGRNLVLSIDRQIQYVAYTELQKAVNFFHAQSGSIVLMDVNTGEILAMVNQPSYNPNNRPSSDDKGLFRNRAVTDVFEPGSTVKAFSVSNALMSGKYKPDTLIDTRPGYFYIGRKRVRDDDNNGVLTVMGVLQKSSNIGVTKMTLSLEPDSLWQLLHKVGYGERTQSGLPGESAGTLAHHHPWRPFTLATLSFGYGLSVTTLQLARAYTILASGGIKRPVSLLKLNNSPSGEQVLDPKIAHRVVDMLQSVVEEGGTAKLANIPGYSVSGKTGTVQIAVPGGYLRDHHIAIFVGMAPKTKPRFVAAIMIKDPKGPHNEYFGGQVSAPVFSRVMGAALRIMAVPPDNLVSQTKKEGTYESSNTP